MLSGSSGCRLKFWIKLNSFIWIHICKVCRLIHSILRSVLYVTLSLDLLELLVRKAYRILGGWGGSGVVEVGVHKVVDLLLANNGVCSIRSTVRVWYRFDFGLLLLQQQHHHYLLLLLIIVTLACIALYSTRGPLFLTTARPCVSWNAPFRLVSAREMRALIWDTSQYIPFWIAAICIFLKHSFYTIITHRLRMMMASCSQEICASGRWLLYIWCIWRILILWGGMVGLRGSFRPLKQLACIWRILSCVILRIRLRVLLLH